MYLELQKRLADHICGVLKAKYDLQLETVPVEIPPDLKFGECRLWQRARHDQFNEERFVNGPGRDAHH